MRFWRTATRPLAWVLCACLAWPAQGAPLTFSQMPPALGLPPAPNVVVTLDFSGSMIGGVDFDRFQPYPIPPGPDGNPLRPEPPENTVYTDAYLHDRTLRATPPSDLQGPERAAWARWKSFYSTRADAMRAAVMSAFSPRNIPDERIRLAWQSLTGCEGFPGNARWCGGLNTMWLLSDSVNGRRHRSTFYDWVRTTKPEGGTPLRRAYLRVGEYLMSTGRDSPWAFLPGQTQLPELGCRRSYHVLFTDGGWNDGGLVNVGNDDFTARTLPDGTAYTPRPPYALALADSLSDIAFRFWATDLQTGPNFSNELSPLLPVPTASTFGLNEVTPYWHPANNPATWQHLVTFAIAFGEAAALTNPRWAGSTLAGSDFAAIMAGTRQWPSTGFDGIYADLWHAAVNSRGSMYVATSQDSLSTAFRSVLGEITAQNTASGGAASSFLVAGADFRVVRAGYEGATTLRGTLTGFGLGANGALGNTPVWNANTELLKVPHGARTVLTSRTGMAGGAPFRWNQLGAWQQAELDRSAAGTPDGLGVARVDYLRGDTLREQPLAGAGNTSNPFRARAGALLGTVVNAQPQIVQAPRSGYVSADYVAFRNANLSRTAVAYVGANDGMLHGFATANGRPLMSYVPRGVFPSLSAYTNPGASHQMLVDGPVITADWHDGAAWRTVLVGALGAGGRGLFALDVTDPAMFSEARAASLVRFDYTAPPVARTSAAFLAESGSAGMMAELATDLGHIATDPVRDAYIGRSLQITRLRNGKWALITGNGVNSVNERAVLYVVYLDGSGYRKLVTEEATGRSNGLSTPLPVDVDSDGLVDVVYAGDMLGRLWKFDLSAKDDREWKVAQASGVNTPLVDTGRPITSAPAVAQHPQGGLLVTFGTGRLMTDADRGASTLEFLYGVWDKPGGPLQVTLADLVTRNLAADSVRTPGGTVEARVLAASAQPIDYRSRRGWRIELGLPRERVVFNPIVQGRLGFFSTSTPAVANSCSVVQAGGALLAFDVINGAQPGTPVLDINGDNLFTSADRIAGRDVMGRASGVGRLIGVLETPTPGTAATPASCAGDMVMGATGTICARKAPGPGRRAWRDLRS